MKTFSILTKENKDIVYLLNIHGSTLRLTKPFSEHSGTYGSLILTVFDDSFKTLKNNIWILDLEFSDNISAKLKENLFMEIPASSLQTLIFS